MKYLKLFESVDPLYEEMPYTEFWSEVTHHTTLSENESDKIIHLVEDLSKNTIFRMRLYSAGKDYSDPKNYLLDHRMYLNIELEDDSSYTIYKMEDEWYLIFSSVFVYSEEMKKALISKGMHPSKIRSCGDFCDDYYRCDQWEGLVQFIKDKIILHNDEVSKAI